MGAALDPVMVAGFTDDVDGAEVLPSDGISTGFVACPTRGVVVGIAWARHAGAVKPCTGV